VYCGCPPRRVVPYVAGALMCCRPTTQPGGVCSHGVEEYWLPLLDKLTSTIDKNMTPSASFLLTKGRESATPVHADPRMKKRLIFFTQRSAAKRSAAPRTRCPPQSAVLSSLLRSASCLSISTRRDGTLLVAPQTRSSSLDQAQPRSVLSRFFPPCPVPPWLEERRRDPTTSPSSPYVVVRRRCCRASIGSDRFAWNGTGCLRPALRTLR
jgi:hypothetical protein